MSEEDWEAAAAAARKDTDVAAEAAHEELKRRAVNVTLRTVRNWLRARGFKKRAKVVYKQLTPQARKSPRGGDRLTPTERS